MLQVVITVWIGIVPHTIKLPKTYSYDDKCEQARVSVERKLVVKDGVSKFTVECKPKSPEA